MVGTGQRGEAGRVLRYMLEIRTLKGPSAEVLGRNEDMFLAMGRKVTPCYKVVVEMAELYSIVLWENL